MLPIALLSTALAGDSLRLGFAHEWGVRATDTNAPMGPGAAVYVGYAFGAPLVKFVPEIGVLYAYGRDVWVPRAGLRVQIGFILLPGIFVHAASPIGSPFEAPTFGFDAGLSLDIELPYIKLGGFGGLQAFGGASGPDIPDVNFIGGLQLTIAIPTSKDDDEDDDRDEVEPVEPVAPQPAPPQPVPMPTSPPPPAPL